MIPEEPLFTFDAKDFPQLLPGDYSRLPDASDFDIVSELLSSSTQLAEPSLVAADERPDELPPLSLDISNRDVPFDPLASTNESATKTEEGLHNSSGSEWVDESLPPGFNSSSLQSRNLSANNGLTVIHSVQLTPPPPVQQQQQDANLTKHLKASSAPVAPTSQQMEWTKSSDAPRTPLQPLPVNATNISKPPAQTGSALETTKASTNASSLVPEEKKLLETMPAGSAAITQLALSRIPSGTSSTSNQGPTPTARPGMPTGGVTEASNTPQSKMRYSEGASASNYCHVCGRASNTIELAACANTRIGLCRKVMCDKCLLLHQRQFFHYAKEPNSSWICMHCRNICPKRARCHQYQKNNLRRRLRNEQRAKNAMKENNRPKTPKKPKKTTGGKTPVVSQVPVSTGRVEKLPSNAKAPLNADTQRLTTVSMPVPVTAAQTAQSNTNAPMFLIDPKTSIPGFSNQSQREMVNPTRYTTAIAPPSFLNEQHNLNNRPVSNQQVFSSQSQSAPLQMVNVPNLSTDFSLLSKHQNANANEISPAGVSSVAFSSEGRVDPPSFGQSETLGSRNC